VAVWAAGQALHGKQQASTRAGTGNGNALSPHSVVVAAAAAL